jgi:hypothetical protein
VYPSLCTKIPPCLHPTPARLRNHDAIPLAITTRELQLRNPNSSIPLNLSTDSDTWLPHFDRQPCNKQVILQLLTSSSSSHPPAPCQVDCCNPAVVDAQPRTMQYLLGLLPFRSLVQSPLSPSDPTFAGVDFEEEHQQGW